MAATLKVSYPVLDESAASLAAIRSEIDRLDDDTAQLSDAVGARALAGALGEFADNWDRHREALLTSLSALEHATRSAAEKWRAADQQLATLTSKPAPR